MIGWLIAAGIAILLGILPLGVSAVYDEDGPCVRVIAGPVRVKLYPAKKEKKEKEKKPKQPSKQKKASPKKEKTGNTPKKGGSFREFLPLVRTILGFLGDFRRKLRVNRLEVNLVMAGDDPCDLAVNYGKTSAALGALLPQLERLFVIKKRSVEAQCDFTADITRITARLDLTITLGRLLGLVCVYGVKLLRQYFTIMKIRKGGAKT